jgi:DNA-directed RNA polymerase subunit RPC12/RpoP
MPSPFGFRKAHEKKDGQEMRLYEIAIDVFLDNGMPDGKKEERPSVAFIDLDEVSDVWQSANGNICINMRNGNMYWPKVSMAEFLAVWAGGGRHSPILSHRQPIDHMPCPDCGSRTINNGKCQTCGADVKKRVDS